MATGPPRLDKDHGFLRFIVQNQVDRDNYEQEQRVLKHIREINREEEVQERQQRSPKPDLENNVYIPPYRRKRGKVELQAPPDKNKLQNDHKLTTTSSQNSEILFELEYVPKDGSPVRIEICKDSSPKQVVEEVADRCNMKDHIKNALHKRIITEIKSKR